MIALYHSLPYPISKTATSIHPFLQPASYISYVFISGKCSKELYSALNTVNVPRGIWNRPADGRECHWESLPWLVKSSVPCLRHSLQNRLVTGKQNCQASRQEVFVEESQLIGEYQTKVWNPQGQIRAVFLKYLWSLWSFYMVILYAHLWKCTHTHTHTTFTKHTYRFHLLLFFWKHHTPCPYLWRFWINKCEVIHITLHF